MLTSAALIVVKIVMASAGAMLCAWGFVLRRRGRAEAHRRLRDRLLLVLGLLAGLCWWNLFLFHQGSYLHVWDTFHYFVGAKYFRELGYTRLYACTVVADAQSGLGAAARARQIRNLETNLVEGTDHVLGDPAQCTRHFSPERWEGFKRDVDWFRQRMSPGHWALGQRDHGYNATPVWTMLGGALAQVGPASRGLVLALTLIDPALLVAMWGVVAWAFGWRAMCVALLYWGTNYPAGWGWNGGAYLRQDWLVMAVIGLCLLRRQRPAAAGVALAWSALLRIFPAVIVVGLGLKSVAGMATERRLGLPPTHRRLAVGAVVAVAVLVPLSLLLSGGAPAWTGFVDNSRKHLATPAWNLVGLETVVAYDHDTRLARTVPLALEADPFLPWQEARRRVAAERRWIFRALLLAYVGLLAWAARRQEDWVAAVLGVGLIAVAAQISCYYWSILLAYGFTADRREEIGAGLCALSVAGGAAGLAFSSEDVRYLVVSATTVGFVVVVTAWIGWSPIAPPTASGADPPALLSGRR